MFPFRLRKKRYEERHKPSEALGTLIELDFDAEIVLHGHFEILPVGGYAQTVSFRAL